MLCVQNTSPFAQQDKYCDSIRNLFQVFEDVVDILDPEMNLPDDDEEEEDYFETESETRSSSHQAKTEVSAESEKP